MSYILEALRKSERQRREMEAEPLGRLAAYPSEAEARKRWRPWITVGLIVVNIAALLLLVWHLFGREMSESRTDPATTPGAAAGDRGALSRAAADALGGDLPQASPESLGFAAAPTAPAPSSVIGERSLARSKKPREKPPASRPAAHPKPQSALRTKTVSRAPPADDQLGQDFAEDAEDSVEALPSPSPRARAKPTPSTGLSTRSSRAREERSASLPLAVPNDGLPRPKINVYAYSAKARQERFVVVGGRKYHEGDRLEDGPAIRRIEETALILDFEGQTYKVPRP